ncbi:heterogeneous nuclear ribonucleoprotein U-like protein 1 isoform X1 [Centruroides vittatus]|uniref:heterogeneous nuclear ribonucleoprotein U-like protein 1 isoform X1 n=1 Tax=Centruroides vittatus TaxID=120091 RepID=UPI0035104CD9
MNQGYYDRRGDKRKRSRSRSPVRDQWGQQSWPDHSFNSNMPRSGTEQFEAHKDSSVALDLYNSDLNLIIDKSQFSAKPLTTEGFAFMWAGARATHGALQGKVCYEVKVMQQLDVSHLPPEEINPHVVRTGWSIEKTSMQLGEEPDSYGYGGTGKASTNCKFKDYGAPFIQGDTVTCYLNADANPIEISYAKNGRHLGIAYRIQREQIGEQALYPHVLTKNCEFFVNFGQLPEPLFPLCPGYENYTFISCAPAAWLERGTLPPTKKEDCEIIMMCGLPGAGKTTWAVNYIALHPDKKYNLLGTNSIIDKMKVMGLPRKRNYAGRWDVLIQKSTKCLNKLLEMGSRELRNYILDQTNVYPSAQKRKMRPFEGFKRKAVVLVPTEEEFQRRCAKRESEEGKDVPDSAVLEMKANFGLPTIGPIFDDVTYV